MTNRILFCATVDYHFKAFHLPYMEWFKEQGWEVHVAASGELVLPFVDKKFNLPINRSPISPKNQQAYKQLKQIIDENQYKIVHCHTPVGGVLARLAAIDARKKGTKVIYTAHGFHFCKGAPLQNWLIYYPIEKALARVTDCLITINEEDYQRAQNHKFKARTISHIHGVGVNTDKFQPITEDKKRMLREALGYHPNGFFMFYAAEFNNNKNQSLLIKALSLIKEEVPNAKLLLAGEGKLLDECRSLAQKHGVKEMVDFLGFRKDIEQLLKISDISVASSRREGLPVNIMEAMAVGLPVIALVNRGHRELITDNKTGWVIEQEEEWEFANKMKTLASDPNLRMQLGINGRNLILQKYSTKRVIEENSQMYRAHMNEGEGVMWAIP